MRSEIEIGELLQKPQDFVHGLLRADFTFNGNGSEDHYASRDFLVKGFEHFHGNGICFKACKIVGSGLFEGRSFSEVSIYVVTGKDTVHVKINHNHSIGKCTVSVKMDCAEVNRKNEKGRYENRKKQKNHFDCLCCHGIGAGFLYIFR